MLYNTIRNISDPNGVFVDVFAWYDDTLNMIDHNVKGDSFFFFLFVFFLFNCIRKNKINLVSGIIGCLKMLKKGRREDWRIYIKREDFCFSKHKRLETHLHTP